MSIVVLFAVLALALLLAAAAVVYRRPQRGLLILAALTPLNGLLPIVPGQAVPAFWKEALIGLTLVCAWLRRRTRPGAVLPLQMPWWPAALLLVLVGSVSAMSTFGPYGLFALKVTFFYLSVVAVLWLAPFGSRDRDLLVTIMMVMAVLAAVVAVLQQIVGPGAMVQLGYEYGQQVRSSGGFFRTFSTFNQPFGFALYEMFVILVCGSVALAEPRRPRNGVFLCLVPLMVASMSTSIVRASVLGLIVGVAWLTLFGYRVLLAPIIAVVLLAIAALPFVPASALRAFFASSSLAERGDRWNSVIESILIHPFGVGLGASGSAADQISVARGIDLGRISSNYQPDNYYMKLLVELGPIGLWLFVTLLVTAVVWSLRLSRAMPGRDGALALGFSASVVAAMAASTVSTYFEIFPLDVHFWLLLGVIGCAAAQRTSDMAPSRFVPSAVASKPT